MNLRVVGEGPAGPFLGARDVFETERDLELPVEVRIRPDPDERTWAGHYDDRHVLNISRQAATSAMARELALHEFAHMARYEERHPSHVVPTEEVLFLSLTGRGVDRTTVAQCHQIANHCKDIYADDITLSVGPAEKLLAFLESRVAAALADRPSPVPGWRRVSPAADPQLTAVNAAFAVALLERHDALPDGHRLYDLADVAAEDAPSIDVDGFRERFRDLGRDPDEGDYRRSLAGAVSDYADARAAAPAAD